MSSDAEYASFLDQANQDPSSGIAKNASSTQQKSKGISAKAVDTEVPASLQAVDGQHFYVSDADEPFEAVSLRWTGGEEVGEDDFSKLIGHKGEVSTISQKAFDPRGQYKEVVSVVEKASGGKGKATIFRIGGEGTRAEYWVVAPDESGEKLVGLKAVAIES